MEKIIRDRLKEYEKQIIGEYQGGFRPRRTITDKDSY